MNNDKTNKNTSGNSTQSQEARANGDFPEKLTSLELNSIKLDVKHTLLTPDYLENLIKGNKEKS